MKYKKPELKSLEQIDDDIKNFNIEFAIAGPNVVEATIFTPVKK